MAGTQINANANNIRDHSSHTGQHDAHDSRDLGVSKQVGIPARRSHERFHELRVEYHHLHVNNIRKL